VKKYVNTANSGVRMSDTPLGPPWVEVIERQVVDLTKAEINAVRRFLYEYVPDAYLADEGSGWSKAEIATLDSAYNQLAEYAEEFSE
jgi:hypothetical protein